MLRGSSLLLSWDVDLGDGRGGRALRDVARQQPECVVLSCGFDRPPDRVPTGAARRERRSVAKGAFVPLERGEDDTALVRLVVVVEQVTGHGARLAPPGRPDIGAPP